MTDMPEKMCIDETSEDEDGLFIAARPGAYLNIDIEYTRSGIEWNEALEAAAKVAEAWVSRAMHLSPDGYEIERTHGGMVKAAANEIRAMKREPKDDTSEMD